MAASTETITHDVFNQSPVFENVNLYASDTALQHAVEREGAGWAKEALLDLGGTFGRADTLEHGRLANENPPTLRAFDTRGHRIDRVEFHPSYHAIMALSIGAGLHASSWDHLADGSVPKAGGCVARAAGFFMSVQAEAGHCCPVTMTHAAVPALMQQPDLAETWIPKILPKVYDPKVCPALQKTGITVGMGMTEKQGGTDVRANTSRAVPVDGGGPCREYLLTGHKWFLSAPMCDLFLMLAQAPGGLSCFLVPRLRDDGSVNGLRLQRLKSKVGNRSNASSEVEFSNAHGWLIGEEGRGVRNIIEMATYTRLDCALGSAGMMRQALAIALNHCAHRTVFQKKLIDQPLMRSVLADMAIESEAATALVMRLGRAYDNALPEQSGNARDAAYKRIMTPAIKYWVCKTGPSFVYEAMETLGGNGYVDEDPMGRIYREIPLNAIWEGSGNVMCLDVLRAAAKAPEDMASVLEELTAAAAGSRELSAFARDVADMTSDHAGLEGRSRLFVDKLVTLAAGAFCLKTRHRPSPTDSLRRVWRPATGGFTALRKAIWMWRRSWNGRCRQRMSCEHDSYRFSVNGLSPIRAGDLSHL